MNETITACENVCKDFSWLAPLAPALIAASAALLIAFVAYPWQKKRDRELQLQTERREAYRAYIYALTTTYLATDDPQPAFLEKLRAARCAYNAIPLYAPAHVAQAFQAAHTEVIAIRNIRWKKRQAQDGVTIDSLADQERDQQEKFKLAFREAIILARMDISNCGRDDADAAVALYDQTATSRD